MRLSPVCLSWETLASRSLFLSLALIALASFLLLFNLGGAIILRHHEALVAVPAQQMLSSGNWLVPYFGGVPRLEKLPLAYWAVAGLGSLSGTISEWTVRLPAALSALLLVALVGLWARRWYGTRVGLCAALIQSTTLYTLKWGRTGTVDMMLCLLIAAALYTAANAAIPSQDPRAAGRRNYYLSIRWCLLAGLAALAKPLFGIIMAVAPCLTFLVAHRRRDLIRNLVHPMGLIVFLILTLAWPCLILREIPSAWHIWQNETLHRAVDTERYYAPFWYYAAVAPILMLPWTPVILWSMADSWRRAWKKADEKERFLWIWFLTQTILLSVSLGKNQHYILPALPALSLIGGQRLAQWLERFDWRNWKLSLRGATLTSLTFSILAITTAMILSRLWPGSLWLPLWSSTAVVILGSALASYFLWAERPFGAVVAAVAALLMGFAIGTGQLSPGLDFRRPAAEFARSVDRHIPRGGPLVVYQAEFTAMYFYADHSALRENTLPGLQNRLAQENRLFVVTKIEMLSALKTIGQVRTVAAMEPPAQAKWKRSPQLVLLEMSAKTPE